MTEYRMKTGKLGEKVVKTAKKVEDAFVDTFLEKVEEEAAGSEGRADGESEQCAEEPVE